MCVGNGLSVVQERTWRHCGTQKLSKLEFNNFFTIFVDDDDDDNAELSDEEAADGDANEAKQRQRRQQV